MTNAEALRAEIAPFSASPLELKKVLIDLNLAAEAPYSCAKSIALASVQLLSNKLVLQADSCGSFSQSYDSSLLEKRLLAISAKYDIEINRELLSSFIDDGSKLW